MTTSINLLVAAVLMAVAYQVGKCMGLRDAQRILRKGK